MTHGGKRVGAGRKAKAEEQKLIEISNTNESNGFRIT